MNELLHFAPDDKVFVVRRDFVRICDGNHAAAAVLSQMYYWHGVKVGHAPQAAAANAIMESVTPGSGQQDTEFWVYKKHAEMQTELFKAFGLNAIGDAFKLLIAKKFLGVRRNPLSAADNTLQYLFLTAHVQAALNCLEPIPAPNFNSKARFNSKETDFNIKEMPFNSKETSFNSKATLPESTPKEDDPYNTPKEDPPLPPPAENATLSPSVTVGVPVSDPDLKKDSVPAKRKRKSSFELPEALVETFEQFWRSYPKSRHIKREDAEKAFMEVNPSPELLQRMLSTLAQQVRSHDWTKEDGRYIPHATTWLNGKRWRDEIVLPGAGSVPQTLRDDARNINARLKARRARQEEQRQARIAPSDQ